MAYIYMPLFFTIIGYGIVYVVSLPIIETISSYGNLIVNTNTPTFDSDELKSIFEAPVNKEERASIPASEVEMPSVGTLYANITSERIGLNAPVYFGDTTTILKNGVGQYIGSSIPGFGAPILLAAHNTTYFLPLQNIQSGDTVTITTSYGIYKYKVTGTRIADRNDKSAYDLAQKKEQLIMYTCYPFNMLGNLQNRYFVYADKISGPVIEFK